MSNVRNSKEHDSWRRAMRAVWNLHPTLTFFMSRGDDIVALGGWTLPASYPVNDNGEGARCLLPPL